MYLYYCILIYILLIALIIYNSKVKGSTEIKNYIYLFLNFSVFIFISAFRASNIGNDTYRYIELFNRLKFDSIENLKDRYEIGYLLLNKSLLVLTDNQQIILIVSSIFILTTYALFIKKYSSNIWLSTFLFFTLGYFSATMNTIRQQIAIAIVLISYRLLLSNKIFKFFILVGIASLFHDTAIIFLFAYPISKLKLDFKNILIFTLITILGFLFFNSLLGSILSDSKYSYYLKTVYLNGEIRLATIMNIAILIVILVFGFFVLKNKEEDKKIKILTLFLLTSLIINIMSLKFNLLDRVAEYFQVFLIIYLPNIIYKIKNKKEVALIIFIIINLFVIYRTSIEYFKPEWNRIYPYEFFWNQ